MHLSQIGPAIRATGHVQGLSTITINLYVCWARRFIVFHGCTHPTDLDSRDVIAFISHLAVDRHLSASSQNQALLALRFMYSHVLGTPLPALAVSTAKRRQMLPHIISHEACLCFIDQLAGTPRLAAQLQYGCGLRLNEVCRLEPGDLLFDNWQIRVGDRYVPMPACAITSLRERTRAIRKYVFGNGDKPMNPRLIQRAYAKTEGKLSSRSLRQAFAIRLLDRGINVRTVQELMGLRDIHSALRCLQVSTQGPTRLTSPLDWPSDGNDAPRASPGSPGAS